MPARRDDLKTVLRLAEHTHRHLRDIGRHEDAWDYNIRVTAVTSATTYSLGVEYQQNTVELFVRRQRLVPVLDFTIATTQLVFTTNFGPPLTPGRTAHPAEIFIAKAKRTT